MVEYGFCIPDNPFDFVRLDNVSIETFKEGPAESSDFLLNLDIMNMKQVIRADLKHAGLNRDVLKLLRADCTPEPSLSAECHNLALYKKWIEDQIKTYPTTLDYDRKLLETVRRDSNFHWMYRHVLLFRIG